MEEQTEAKAAQAKADEARQQIEESRIQTNEVASDLANEQSRNPNGIGKICTDSIFIPHVGETCIEYRDPVTDVPPAG